MRRSLDDLSLSRSGVIRPNPFPGLRAFEPEEDHLFFGRETQIDELLRRLRKTRFLAVLGTSGSGKSSLVRSGLVPALYNGYMVAAGSSWRVALLRPGEDPMGNLATGLSHPEVLGGPPGGGQGEDDSELAEIQRELTLATLLSSGLGLAESVLQARIPADDNVLVIVDQFEELFRFKSSRRSSGKRAELPGSAGDAVAFVELLLEAARQEAAPIYVVLTMRSDFIGNCMEFPGLPEAVNNGLYLVPRMSRQERRLAITGPVAVGGAPIAPRLVTRLLNDVGDDPDQLPILQHALMRTWSHWSACCTPEEPIDVEDYEGIGAMSEALSRHAEGALQELDGRQLEIAEKMFKALTEKDADNRGIRRPCRLEEICAVAGAGEREVIEVVECFRLTGRAFLMPPAGVPLDGDSIVDISHESLMRVWDRLIGWVEEEAESAQTYLRLSKAAAFHDQGVGGLWRGQELQVALPWLEKHRPTAAWAERWDPHFERSMAFLEESRATHEARIARQEQERRKKLRRTRWLAAVLGSAALITLAFGLYALQLRDEAISQRAEAESQRIEAERQRAEAEVQKAAAEAEREHAEQQRREAEAARRNAEQLRRLAEEQRHEALRQRSLADRERGRATISEQEALAQKAQADRARDDAHEQKERAEAARRQAQAAEGQARRLHLLTLSHALAVESSQLRQDQGQLAALLALQAYRLHRENGGEPDPGIFQALRRGRDHLLSGPENGVVFRHRAGAAIRAIVMAPDGAWLAAGSDNGELHLLDPAALERPPRLLAATGSRIRALAVDATGRWLAAGRFDGSIQVWDPRRPAEPPRTFAAHGDSVDALAFPNGGAVLASGSLGGELKLWRLDRPGDPGRDLGRQPGARVTAVATPAGAALAVAGPGGVSLFDLSEAGAPPRAVLAEKDVRSLAYSADGRWLAGGEAGGAIVLLDLVGGGAPAVRLPGEGPSTLTGHLSSVNALAFSPRHDLLASGSSDHGVRLWDLRRPGSEPIVLAGHGSWVWSLAFDPAGGRLFSGGADRTLRRWPTRAHSLAEELCRLLSRELDAEEWNLYLGADVERGQACPPPPPAAGEPRAGARDRGHRGEESR